MSLVAARSRTIRSGLLHLAALAVLVSACTADRRSAHSVDNKVFSVAFSGDLAGQNVCRDAVHGFPIFAVIQDYQPDVFVALGDMIYADSPCTATGRYGNRQVPGQIETAVSADQFAARWQYVLSDPLFSGLLADTRYLAVWDDHEIVNDFFPGLVDTATSAAARQAFARQAGLDDAPLYRSVKPIDELELFLLDTRSYRDPNGNEDSPTKSMLGLEQRQWLTDQISASTAIWKVLVSSVPLSIPTGYPPENGRDGWASGDSRTGFESELQTILTQFARDKITGLIVIAADVHHATGFDYQPFPDAYPEFQFTEYVVGPLQAGIFPSTDLDPTFRPQRWFYHAPESIESVESFESALGWFNFGLIEVREGGDLTIRVVDGNGEVIAQRIHLRPPAD